MNRERVRSPRLSLAPRRIATVAVRNVVALLPCPLNVAPTSVVPPAAEPSVAVDVAFVGAQFASARICRSTNAASSNHTQTTLSDKKRPSNSLILKPLQKSAHLTDNRNFQVPAYSYSCALFSRSPFIFSTLTLCVWGYIYPAQRAHLIHHSKFALSPPTSVLSSINYGERSGRKPCEHYPGAIRAGSFQAAGFATGRQPLDARSTRQRIWDTISPHRGRADDRSQLSGT